MIRMDEVPTCMVSGCGHKQQSVKGHYYGLCAIHMADLVDGHGLPRERAEAAVRAYNDLAGIPGLVAAL